MESKTSWDAWSVMHRISSAYEYSVQLGKLGQLPWETVDGFIERNGFIDGGVEV